jgi:hypothetical protein
MTSSIPLPILTRAGSDSPSCISSVADSAVASYPVSSPHASLPASPKNSVTSPA